MLVFFCDNPAMEIWASLAMFKLKSLNLKFPPLFKAWEDPSLKIQIEDLFLFSKKWVLGVSY